MRWRKRSPEDFQAEIDAHVALEADALRGEGRSDADAAALRAFGNRTSAEERFYEAGRWMPLENLWRDLRFAARVLLKDARFSALATLGLALGIGISTAIFSLVNASYREGTSDPAGSVRLFRLIDGRPRGDLSYAEFRAFEERAKSLRSFQAISGHERFLLGPLAPGGEAEEVDARFVEGLAAILGRGFTPEEGRTGTPAVALLDRHFWKRRFASDPGVVGRTVTLNAHPFTIVGVADLRNNLAPIYLPLGAQPQLMDKGDWLRDPASRWLMVGALLRPGVSLARAQAEIDVLDRSARGLAAGVRDGSGVLLSAGSANPDKRKEILAVMTAITLAVSMIPLIACSNLANLLLARASARRREIGARLSLGATRARLVSQLLTESMLLAFAGGALGILFSNWLARSLALMASRGTDLPFELGIDWRVLLYAFALSAATGVAFGLGPALAATRMNISAAMHGQSESDAASPRSKQRTRNLLVAVPLAVSLMLLLAAGIAVRRVQRSYLDGPSFETRRLLGVSLRLHMQGYDEARRRVFERSFRERVAAMPNVADVALATSMPGGNGYGWFRIAIDGAANGVGADYNAISPEFFHTIGAVVVRGRGFTAADREGAAPVALVNQEFARRYWPAEEPIGKRIRLDTGAAFFEVVGIAPDMGNAAAEYNTVRPTVYIPNTQAGSWIRGGRTAASTIESLFLIRVTGEPAVAKTALRQEIRAADPALRVDFQTVQEMIDANLGQDRAVSMLLTGLGALALLMASIGVYAVLAYAVSQRTREIGIRVALGARPREILALVMRRTAVTIGWGVGSGLAGAIALSRLMARSLAKLGHLDAATCVTVSLLLASVALIASYLPARKALRVDPALSLRAE